MSARSVIAFTRLIDFLGSVRDDGEALALWLDANADGQALSRVARRMAKASREELRMVELALEAVKTNG